MESFRIKWEIPENAKTGVYQLRIEFEDMDIDSLPGIRWFDVR